LLIGSHLQVGTGLVPLPLLEEIFDGLVDQDLAVVGLRDAQALEAAAARALRS
jgi:hypothetical protein